MHELCIFARRTLYLRIRARDGQSEAIFLARIENGSRHEFQFDVPLTDSLARKSVLVMGPRRYGGRECNRALRRERRRPRPLCSRDG